MSLGTILIQIATLLAVVSFVSAVRWARGHEPSGKTFRLAYHGMSAALLGASVLLMMAILTHDFRFDYVIGYSSRDMPTIYLISAFWAGQAGTYLLWALMGAGIGYLLFRKHSWRPAAVMACYVPTIGFQLALMLNKHGNPFTLAPQTPPDGRGLNLLLQDPWMASHPPLVFLGYVAATIPAVLALVAIWKRDEKGWLSPAIRWTMSAFVLLGFGIILGGFWAYKVLGWGGYWGWDPVENASLVPWIVLIALAHGLLVQRKAGSLHRSNLWLALSAYVLVIYGTFLTRSGVLADVSVHSFPAGSIYQLLVVILLAVIGVSVYAMTRRKGPSGKEVAWTLSWPLILSLSVGLLLISAVFVLIGTSWPMVSFSDSAGSMFESLGWGALKESAIRPPWYNAVSLPLYIVLFGFLAIGPFLAWAFHNGQGIARKLMPSLVVATAGTGAAYYFGGRGAGVLLLFFMALAALTSNVIRLVLVGRHHMLHTGAALAHVGFAMMFVGIVASSAWGTSATALLPLGEPTYALGHTLTFQGHVEGSEPRHRWRVRVQRDGVVDDLVELGMFSEGGPDQLFRKPGIMRRLDGDLYMAPQQLEVQEAGGTALELARGEAVPYGDATLTFVEFDRSGKMQSEDGMVVRAVVDVTRGEETERGILSLLAAPDGRMHGHAVQMSILPGVQLTLQRIAVEQGLLLVQAMAPGDRPFQAMTVEVSQKPFIGFLWVGTFLLSLGCCVAVARRVVDERAARRLQEMAAERAVPLRARTEKKQATRRKGESRRRAS
jgi:cytochrome c-type biogenesis protein CcmF